MIATHAALPPDDPMRVELHDELHARPPARVPLPALVVYVAVLHEGVSRSAQAEHLRRLPGRPAVADDDLDANFLRLDGPGFALKWERHTEFTRYSLVQSLPRSAALPAREGDLPAALAVPTQWLQDIPGRTLVAVHLAMLTAELDDPLAALDLARHWFGDHPVVGSAMGQDQALAVTDFRLRETGFSHMLVLARPGTSDTRAGRLAQRLLEIETYRMLALRGLPLAKQLGPPLSQAEAGLADIMQRLEAKQDGDGALLDRLVALAAGVERATAEHMYRFSATEAYAALVAQRIAELRESPVPGTQTIGEFMQRRLSPAIATVAATGQRLVSLSQRIERAGALLRTQVDIATESQNQQLLAKLTRGQAMQLRLQTTVEGLSIAAISYYVVSLLLYAAKAAKAAGLPMNPEIAAGATIPLVLWAVASLTRRVRKRLHGPDD